MRRPKVTASGAAYHPRRAHHSKRCSESPGVRAPAGQLNPGTQSSPKGVSARSWSHRRERDRGARWQRSGLPQTCTSRPQSLRSLPDPAEGPLQMWLNKDPEMGTLPRIAWMDLSTVTRVLTGEKERRGKSHMRTHEDRSKGQSQRGRSRCCTSGLEVRKGPRSQEGGCLQKLERAWEHILPLTLQKEDSAADTSTFAQ